MNIWLGAVQGLRNGLPGFMWAGWLCSGCHRGAVDFGLCLAVQLGKLHGLIR